MSDLFITIGFVLFFLTLPGTLELLFVTVGAIGNRLIHPISSPAPIPLNFNLAVIICAHNEEKQIARTLKSLQAAGFSENIWVVADNCSDATGEIARKWGAHVLQRVNALQIGKHYALDFAFNSLELQKYDAYLIIDADTIMLPNLKEEINKQLKQGVETLQICYGLMNVNSSLATRFMNLTFEAFNHLRPLGRKFWGLSTGILGNGFMITRSTLNKVPFQCQSVVEDLEYHLKLVDAGLKVQYTDDTKIFAETPTRIQAASDQRSRWEGGRLRLLIDFGPELLKKIVQGHWRLLEPLLDLMLFPLAYHVLLLLPFFFIPSHFLKVYALFSLCVVGFHIIITMVIARATWKDVLALTFLPFYLIWKIGIISKIFRGASKGFSWTRTER